MTRRHDKSGGFFEEESSIPIIRLKNHFIVSIQVSLEDRQALKLQDDILRAIQKMGADGLVIDISTVTIMDSYIARILSDIARNAQLMGTPTTIVGMRPAIAITLVTMGMEFANIRTALNLDEALESSQAEQDEAIGDEGDELTE